MRVDTAYPLLRERHRRANLAALGELFEAMAADVAARFDAGARVLLATRWDAALRDVLLERNTATATEVAGLVATALGADYDPAIMAAWLARNAEIGAASINDAMRERLDGADADQVDAALTELTGSRAAYVAGSIVTTIAGFAARDVAVHAGAAAKVWKVNSNDPRSQHARMRGETVPVDRLFSNGMDWPGDPDGGADEVANCRCSMTILT
jgi:hypothetical protein